MSREQVCHLACYPACGHSSFPNVPNPNCVCDSKHQKWSLDFRCGKELSCFPKIISMWWHQGIFWGIRFSLLPHFHSFILYFFSSGWWGWFRHSSGSLPFFQEGLSSDRSLFPGFVSVICGHYINIHGWPEEWEKGCNTHTQISQTTRVSAAVAIFFFKSEYRRLD